MSKYLGSRHGFALIGVAVALAILATMSVGLAGLVSSNQRSRISKTHSDQSFYSAHAALEYSLRNARALGTCNPPIRQFLSKDLGITRAGGKFNAASYYGANDALALSRYSVTVPPGGNPPVCVSVLAPSGSGAVDISGSADLSMTSCALGVNSSNASALTISGSASLTTALANLAGGYTVSGSAQLNGPVATGANLPSVDPFAAIPMPTYSACTYTNFSVSGNATLSPGVYCKGLKISGSGTVTLSPGSYIIDGGNFDISGSATVTGSEVTIFLNSQLQSGYAQLDLTGSGNLTLSPPTSGTYKGITFFQSRNAPAGTNKITGSAGANITGAIYLPNQSLSFRGSSSSNAPCTMLVVNKVAFQGSTNINCTSPGVLDGIMPMTCS